MAETMDDVRYDIADTRQRMSATIAELDSRVEARKDALVEKLHVVTDRVSADQVIELVRQHPWAAVAVALGLGALVSRTGADRAVVAATADAAASAARSTADAARSAATAVVSKVKGSGSDAEVPIEAQREVGDGLVDRLAGQVGRVIRIDELESDMRRAFVSQKLPTSI